MLLWKWKYKNLFESLLSILVGIYPEVELLNHMVILIIFRSTILFSTVATLSYILNSNAHGLKFLHILANTCYFLLFYSGHLMVCSGISFWLIKFLIDLLSQNKSNSKGIKYFHKRPFYTPQWFKRLVFYEIPISPVMAMSPLPIISI